MLPTWRSESGQQHHAWMFGSKDQASNNTKQHIGIHYDKDSLSPACTWLRGFQAWDTSQKLPTGNLTLLHIGCLPEWWSFIDTPTFPAIALNSTNLCPAENLAKRLPALRNQSEAANRLLAVNVVSLLFVWAQQSHCFPDVGAGSVAHFCIGHPVRSENGQHHQVWKFGSKDSTLWMFLFTCFQFFVSWGQDAASISKCIRLGPR
jgi:hypothetical protein